MASVMGVVRAVALIHLAAIARPSLGTPVLLARFHPSSELRRPLVGREVPFDLTRSRDLLGFSADHGLPE
jgi:hypothetical protein